MTPECALISELSSAKENIRRKYSMLKQGEADTQSFVAQTFKPIIEPLNQIQNNSYIKQEEYKQDEEDKNYSSENIISDTVDSWFNSKVIDRTYGPKKKL